MAEIKLAPYQNYALDKMVQAERFLLADAPGVGKSYPAIAAAAVHAGPKLVICPAHLIHQWCLYLAEMGHIGVPFVGTPRKKHRLLVEGHGWLVASYHALGQKHKSRRFAYVGLQGPWGAAILDEAHALRNPKSHWTKAALRISTDALYMLTGTPEIAHAGNLYVLAKMLDRLPHRSFWTFVDEHCESDLGHFGRTIGGLKRPEAFHRTVFDRTCYLRRTLHQVGLGIDKPVIHDIHLKLDKQAQGIHDTAKRDYRDENDEPIFDAGKLSHYLRRIASWPPKGTNPKLQALRHVLEKHPNKRVVVLTWYRAVRDKLAHAFPGPRQVRCVRAEDHKLKQHSELLAWQNSKNAVLVGTLPHLKEGVDGLQCASVLFLYERSWLHAENEQAVARLVRRGQESTVHVYRPVVDDTFDEAVATASDKREQQTLRDLLGGYRVSNS